MRLGAAGGKNVLCTNDLTFIRPVADPGSRPIVVVTRPVRVLMAGQLGHRQGCSADSAGNTEIYPQKVNNRRKICCIINVTSREDYGR